MSSQVVMKVLIDLDNYEQLLTYKEEVLKLHDKKKKELENVSSELPIQPKKQLSQREQLSDQVGNGNDIETRIAQTVIRQLSRNYNLEALQKLLEGNQKP